MTKFQYKALKNKTEFVEGEIEANSPREARQKILALGFLPTKVYTECCGEKQSYAEQSSVLVGHIQNVKRLSLNEKYGLHRSCKPF